MTHYSCFVAGMVVATAWMAWLSWRDYRESRNHGRAMTYHPAGAR